MLRTIVRLLPAMLLLAATTADARPAQRSRQNADAGNGDAARLLALHNALRAEAGTPPLVWNARLADDARGWAASLARRGAFEHSPQPRRRDAGENLFTGKTGNYQVEAMIGRFADEKRYFRPGRFPAISATGNWQDVGHYSQIVWRTTREVGCAIATGRGRDTLVCRYAPPGNIHGEMVP